MPWSLVAVFSGVMFSITGKLHDREIALAYLGYAVLPFLLTFIFGYYQNKLGRVLDRIVARHNALVSQHDREV